MLRTKAGKSKKPYSLQTKIVFLVTSLIVLVVILSNGAYAYLELQNEKSNARQYALQDARLLATQPAVETSFLNRNWEESQYIIEQITSQTDANHALLLDRDMHIVAKDSDQNQTLTTDQRDSVYSSVVFGKISLHEIKKNGEQIISAYAPIYVDYGEYFQAQGSAVIEYSLNEIYSSVWAQILKTIALTFIVLILGLIGAVWLSKSVRADILGLEPYEIANIYAENTAILHSIREGIVAVDSHYLITMVNDSAVSLLNDSVAVGSSSISVFSSIDKNEDLFDNKEIIIENKTLIINKMPIVKNEFSVGYVYTLRDKTELKHMINTLSDVKKYSEDLRAQTHEYMNKLYLLLGLIQLGEYKEAENVIQEEAKMHTMQTDVIFGQIKDQRLQAILVGKAGAASEKKVLFYIDKESRLNTMPAHISISSLVIIIGNIIDNALEAAVPVQAGEVSFFITDLGDDVVIEVRDNGKGFSKEDAQRLVEQKYSTKGSNRGYGLANVMKELENIEGWMEFHTNAENETVVTLFIPKVLSN